MTDRRGRNPLPIHYKVCDYDGCTDQTETHQWAKKNAQSQGWFFQRNGMAWCPAHNPEWVEEWRAKQRDRGI